MNDDRDIRSRAADQGERHPEPPPHRVDPTTHGGGLGDPVVGDMPGADYEPAAQRGERARIEEAELGTDGRSIGGIESRRDSDVGSRMDDDEPSTTEIGVGAEPSLVDRIASAASRMFGGAVHDGGGTGTPSGRVDGRASVEGRDALDTEGPDPAVADRVRDPGEG